MKKLNGYTLIKDWYQFKADNITICKAVHSDMYCYLVDLWNRIGQKDDFGLPTAFTMECLGIGSYNTYKKTLNDLVRFGFVRVTLDSKNQHSSKRVALSKYDEATDKAVDKATDEAVDKAVDTIDKLIQTDINSTNSRNKNQGSDDDNISIVERERLEDKNSGPYSQPEKFDRIQTAKKLYSDSHIIERVGMKQKLSLKQLKSPIQDFVDFCEMGEKFPREFQESKTHFWNWISKQDVTRYRT